MNDIKHKTRFVLYCVVLSSSLFLFPSCSSEANHSEDKGFLKQVLSLFTSSKDKMKQQKDVYQDGSSVGPKEVADLVMRAKKAGLYLPQVKTENKISWQMEGQRKSIPIEDNHKNAENFRDNESKMNARFEEMERLANDGKLDEAMKKIAEQGKLTVGGVDVPVKK